jgi:NADH-quinone oxidoreductase subunit G
MKGRNPKLFMDIHSVSEVNKPNIHLSQLDRPAHSNDFNQ